MSNPTIESIMTTRAIRRFTAEPVSDEDLTTCLRAAQQAPSGGNVQPQQYLVVTDPDRRAAVARWYRSAFDRYEASLPDPTSFRSADDEASWRRTRDASRHLADHLDEAPAIVLFLQPIIPWTPRDEQGEMDIGRLDASVYPAVQNFCVAARSLGLGTALTTVIRIHTVRGAGRARRARRAASRSPPSSPSASLPAASASPAASPPTPSPTGTSGATAAADPTIRVLDDRRPHTQHSDGLS